MNTDIRWKISLTQLGKALARLSDILKEPLDKNDYVLDASIQRFEFCVELYWKTFKHLLAMEGVTISFPKEALQQAFAAGWLDDETLWLAMMRDRNLTSHTYEHENAMATYKKIQHYYPEMDRVYTMLVKKFVETSS